MKIDYNILWLDDKKQEIEEDNYLQEIKEHLLVQGFNPVIQLVDNEKDFFEKLNDNFDLILTDYHLNEEENFTRNGDVIVREVREKSVHTEIMFYSARGELVDTHKLNRITFIESSKHSGSHYEIIITEAQKLIDLTIKKFQHIITMRGMIMHETSDLDVKISDIFNTIVDKIEDTERLNIIFVKDYKDISKTYLKNCRNKRDSHLTDYKKYFSLSDSYRKWLLTKEVLKISNISSEFDLKLFRQYSKEVINVRNKFAHAKLEIINDEMVLKGRTNQQDYSFTSAACVEIRKKIGKHKNNINKLMNFL